MALGAAGPPTDKGSGGYPGPHQGTGAVPILLLEAKWI